MKPTKVSVNIGQTFNIGNYESARVDVQLEGTIDEVDETPQQAVERVYIEAKKAFTKVANNFVPKKKE